VRDSLSHRVHAWQTVNLRLAVPQLLSIRISHTTLGTVSHRLQNHQFNISRERGMYECLRRRPVIRQIPQAPIHMMLIQTIFFSSSSMVMRLFNLSHRLKISVEQSRADPGHPWLKGFIVAQDIKIAIVAGDSVTCDCVSMR
jgi:hypothetical protein